MYWAVLRIWDDGTHEIVIPAIDNASGCGVDFAEAQKDVREKLACMVESSMQQGLPTAVLSREQTEIKAQEGLTVIKEECSKFGFEVPHLMRQETIQIDLDYSLINSTIQGKR